MFPGESIPLQSADIIFTHGEIFTGVGAPIIGSAVVVVGDRIHKVIPESQLDSYADAHTHIIDLHGALLSPGFQDAHIHAVSGGTELLQCNLSESVDAEDALARVAEYAAANPELPWIVGGGWSMDHFPGGAPLATQLDAVVADCPVSLFSRDHHSLWANTAAITASGVTAETPDPTDGYAVRDADGNPLGTFHEGAGDLITDHVPPLTPDLVYRGLLRAQDELTALGITGWQEAIIENYGSPASWATALLTAIDRETLKVHVQGAQWWDRHGSLDQVDEMVQRREDVAARVPSGQFRMSTTKIMVDGVAENRTAGMLDPYLDEHGQPTDNSGLSYIDPELLKEVVTRLDAAGQQAHFHALGDRAVRESLDAIEAARVANGPTDNRHHIAHLQMVSVDDAPRFAELGATANIQALWATHETQLDVLTLPFLRRGAEERHYPFGDLARADATFCAGSDWPVSDPSPIAAIHIAVNRAYPGSALPPLGGTIQAIDLAAAFAAYTSGSARINHRDDTGYIRPGYRADLAVISPNPFELPSTEIYTATVQSTWINGEAVFVHP